MELDFPTPKSARVNWGETISNVRVTVECEPAQGSKWVDVSLEIYRDGDSSPSPVAQKKEVVVQDGSAVTEFGDYQIVQGRAGEGQIHIPEPGEWKLGARVRCGGEDVESARRRLYVATDPPDRPQPKPHTISFSVKNVTRQEEQRINNGDEIAAQVTVTNRDADDAMLEVDASLEDLLLADGKEFTLDGVPIGDVPSRQPVVSERLRVYTSSHSAGSEPHIVLQPGRYYLRADLKAPEVEEQWRILIPDRELEPQRIERDIFAMGLWLQEQELEDALATFGGSLQNALEIQRRESLRSTKMRSALGRWFLGLDPIQRSRLFKGREFIAIAKVLRQRWPSRGPGSAKRPVHFTDHDLDREVSRVLSQFSSTE